MNSPMVTRLPGWTAIAEAPPPKGFDMDPVSRLAKSGTPTMGEVVHSLRTDPRSTIELRYSHDNPTPDTAFQTMIARLFSAF